MHICTVCHVRVHGVNCGQCNNWDNNIKDSITCDRCYNKYKHAFTVIDAFKMLKKDPWAGLGMIGKYAIRICRSCHPAGSGEQSEITKSVALKELGIVLHDGTEEEMPHNLAGCILHAVNNFLLHF